MTYDNSHDGADNGSGGRTYDSVQQILNGQAAVHAVTVKAESDPSTLTDADLAILPGEITSRLMASGQLSHLGLGGRRKRR